MWAVEKDPALRSDFINITILEREPDPVRFRANIEQALARDPEADPAGGLGTTAPRPARVARRPALRPRLPRAPRSRHRHRVGSGSCSTSPPRSSATPLDRSRPLWEFTLVDGLEGGGAALLQKVHHTITDGVGGVKLSLSLLDFEADPAPPDRPTPAAQVAAEYDAEQRSEVDGDPIARTTPFEVFGDAMTFAVGNGVTRARRGFGSAASLALHPTERGQRASETARLLGSIRRQLFVTEPSHSELMRPRSLGRVFDAFQASLDDSRRVASALGGSVNDVVRHRRHRRTRPLPRAHGPAVRDAAHGHADQHARERRRRGVEQLHAGAGRGPGPAQGPGGTLRARARAARRGAVRTCDRRRRLPGEPARLHCPRRRWCR